MNQRPKSVLGKMGTHRVEALSDGVFAIIMTLLVFDIKIPDVPVAELGRAILRLWPNLVGYCLSFVLLGIYWVGHRNQFAYIRRVDQILHWINIAFFAVSALVPFSTGLLSRYPGQWLSVAIYGANLIAIGLALYGHWSYATHDNRLVDDDLPLPVVRLAKQRTLLGPACYLVAILLGLLNPTISLIVYALVPLLYVIPGAQNFWNHLAHR